MTFATPLVLWGLFGPALAALALAVLGFLRRRRSWSRWPGITRVVAVGGKVHPIAVGHGTRRPWLLLVAVALALLALARPRWGVIEEPVYQKSREVMIALDLSRSMLTQDVLPSRLDRSRLLVRSLLDGLRGERVGLIVFAGTAFVQVPMSSDYQILDEFLPELKPEYMPQGGSDYEGMLRAALSGFGSAAETDRYLIILSDGEAQDDKWRAQLGSVKEKSIRVISLGVGTTGGGFIPDPKTGAYVKDPRGAVVLSKLEPATLQALAFETSGTYRDASAWIDLAALLQETIERGRQGAFTEKRAARPIERFQWFLGPALLFALLGVWREIPIRPRARLMRSLAPRSTSRIHASASTLAVAAVLAGMVIHPSATRAAVEDQTPATSVDKLRTTVSRLAVAPAVAPAGWKAMAEQTLALGQELQKSRQPLEPGVVYDALAAVDAGERIDARAADWARLREELRTFLESPPPAPQDDKKEPPDEKKQDDQQQQPSGSQGETEENQQRQQDRQQQQNQKQDGAPQQSQQSQSKQQQDSRSPSTQDQQQQKASPQEGKPQGSAADQPKTRKFGGKQESAASSATVDPEMAAALARLDQVQENDRPAILHQRMEEESEKQHASPGSATNPHDW